MTRSGDPGRTVIRPWAAILVCLAALVASAPGCKADPERLKRDYVQSGDQYFQQEKYKEAVVEYKNALQHDSKFGEARLKLAQAYEKLQDPANTSREYIRAADALPGNVGAQLKAAEYLIRTRRFEDAKARAEGVLALEPANVEALVLLGNALAGLKNFDGALAELEEAVKLNPSSASGHALMGAVQMARGHAIAAEKALRRAVELAPDGAASYLALANYLWSAGRVVEAEGALKDALRVDPRSVLAHRALAALYITTRRPELAESHLKVLADRDQSTGANLKLALADYYLVFNRPEQAMAVLEGLSQTSGAKSAAEVRLAAIKYEKESKQAGTQMIDGVLTREPQNVPALLIKTRFLLAEGNLDGALTTAQTAAAAEPQSILAHYTVGTIQRARRRPAEAIQAFNEVLKINSRATAAQMQLAELNFQQGQTKTALQLATDAASQVPNDARVQLTLIQALAASGQIEQAHRKVEALQKALPNVARVQAMAGAIALARKDAAGARKAYSRAAELDGANLDALAGLLRLDFAEKNTAAALKRVSDALAKGPDNPALLTLAARVHTAAGDTRQTEQVLRRAIEIDPGNLEAYSLLGDLYASQRRLPEARASFEKILLEQPESVAINTIVAMLYETEGNKAEARKRYERVLQIDGNAAVAANNLAYIYAEEGGNLDIALQLAQVAKQKLPDNPYVTDTLAWVYVKKELATLAIPQLEQALTKLPDDPVLTYHLGTALVKAGSTMKGRKALERALSLRLPPPAADEARRLIEQL